MTQAEALDLDEDLQHLKALRENRVWQHHLLPEFERIRAEQRTGMRDRALSPEQRCEHVNGFEIAESLLEFLDLAEARMRAALKEHDAACAIIERPWSSEP